MKKLEEHELDGVVGGNWWGQQPGAGAQFVRINRQAAHDLGAARGSLPRGGFTASQGDLAWRHMRSELTARLGNSRAANAYLSHYGWRNAARWIGAGNECNVSQIPGYRG